MPVGETLNAGMHGAANLGHGVLNKSKGFCQEFKDFLNKGNAFDLAVAFVIATAFSAVVKSLVDDIITPIFGLANNRNLDEMFLVIRCGRTCSYPTIALAQADGAVTWNWGRFINTVINLILVGLFLFLLVKLYYTLRRKAFVKDKPCPYCGKDMSGDAVRCPFCTSWLDQDVRRKVDGDLNQERSMSTTTFGSSGALLREKDQIEVVTDGHTSGNAYQQGMNPNPLNPYANQNLAGAQMGTAAGMATNLAPQFGGAGAGGIGMSGGLGGGPVGASNLSVNSDSNGQVTLDTASATPSASGSASRA
ncbi:large conductance mechanosensitive channel [Entomortierella parvispora]|uniref:Large conductance mechanosensitive channel n=1 Tax=Entomortierella parvispora TaxID=205924 RepID=A0A9P3HBF1_9FUNG|nr:large conductance mechanosensitive channel [Entomortierella parvispora]